MPPPRCRRATMPRKETKSKEGRKNGSGQKLKLSTPTQAIDARIGEGEKNRKQNYEQKKNREWPPNQATWTIWSPLTTRMDHTVDLF